MLQLGANLAGFSDDRLGGASTITMQWRETCPLLWAQLFTQVQRNVAIAKNRAELSKQEILELYINLVPFGKRAYGAQAAAVTYYGKPLGDLSLAQLAMLAGIPQRPEAGNPINGPEWALRRRNQVLGRMLDQQSISRTEYDEAVRAPITAKVYARELDLPSPYVSEWARQSYWQSAGPIHGWIRNFYHA